MEESGLKTSNTMFRVMVIKPSEGIVAVLNCRVQKHCKDMK